MISSIEWLEQELWEQVKFSSAINNIFKKAKEMHRKEIIDAYMDRMDVTNKEVLANIIGEEYYQKTFK
jgi:hypothetical protein